MVIVMFRIKVKPGKAVEAMSTIRSIVGMTEAQPACKSCRLYIDTGDVDTFLLLDEWDSQEALETQIRSSEFKNILAAIEMGVGPPEISFSKVSSKRGFDLVEEIRLQNGNPAGNHSASPIR